MKKIYNIKYAINTLPSISRSKGSQTMKFGQLIEYNTRKKILFKNHTQSCSQTPFLKIELEHIAGSIV